MGTKGVYTSSLVYKQSFGFSPGNIVQGSGDYGVPYSSIVPLGIVPETLSISGVTLRISSITVLEQPYIPI